MFLSNGMSNSSIWEQDLLVCHMPWECYFTCNICCFPALGNLEFSIVACAACTVRTTTPNSPAPTGWIQCTLHLPRLDLKP
jgi:hypothetical protein